MKEVVLVRWSEIFLKGDNRHLFERALVDNARRAIAEHKDARIERVHGRLFAWPGERGAASLVGALGRVFGVASLSAARVVAPELEAIAGAAVEVLRAAVGDGKPTFKVESRRADKQFPMSSMELSRAIGGAIVNALGLPVDVHTPRYTLGVEVQREHAFVFLETVPGPGGLPSGTAGRVELLLSGGIDSPVAGWLMQKRGCLVGATYFHSFPYTGDKTKDKVTRLAQKLAASQQAPLRLTVVPFTDAQKALRQASEDGRLAVVLYRRMMMRVAEQIARRAGAEALVTGEALAQVASQTLPNMAAIGAATTMAVLRPLVGHDKQDTITIARRIGTYETSIEPYDDCCSLFVPEHPETRAKLEVVQAVERRVDVAALVEACLAGVEVIEVR